MLSWLDLATIWATSWQNQQNDCAPSEDSDQPGHPPSLIGVLAVRSLGGFGPKLSSCGQRKLWSDWADESLLGAHAILLVFIMRRLILMHRGLKNCVYPVSNPFFEPDIRFFWPSRIKIPPACSSEHFYAAVYSCLVLCTWDTVFRVLF